MVIKLVKGMSFRGYGLRFENGEAKEVEDKLARILVASGMFEKTKAPKKPTKKDIDGVIGYDSSNKKVVTRKKKIPKKSHTKKEKK